MYYAYNWYKNMFSKEQGVFTYLGIGDVDIEIKCVKKII